jgi:nitrite reductase (NADH) small subunit
MTTVDPWIFVSKKQDIPVLGARIVTGAAAGPIALFKTLDQTIFAVLDRCPHKGGPLSQGIVHGRAVT